MEGGPPGFDYNTTKKILIHLLSSKLQYYLLSFVEEWLCCSLLLMSPHQFFFVVASYPVEQNSPKAALCRNHWRYQSS
jgi:hypothetical protein